MKPRFLVLAVALAVTGACRASAFTNEVLVERNEITRCRYGVHSMYSRDAKILNNVLSANLLGAALMLSDRLSCEATGSNDTARGRRHTVCSSRTSTI